MANDEKVFLIGLGVPTPTAVFGTTRNISEKYGEDRVLDIPASENAMTGAALGASILGLKPIFIHHRVDFSILSLEPIVNQAAKWHFMYGQTMTAPLVIRMIVGRGWGQGPQHSQSMQAWFAHIPGLKILMPATPKDAKQLLIAAVQDASPVIILEHRWLYDLKGEVPESFTPGTIGRANILTEGTDITLISNSIMSIECVEAAKFLKMNNISAEVIDLATIRPFDKDTILKSVAKTKNLVVIDNAHLDFGITGELITTVVENLFEILESAPLRLGFGDTPTPTSISLIEDYYPDSISIFNAVMRKLNREIVFTPPVNEERFIDVPNKNFTGPY